MRVAIYNQMFGLDGKSFWKNLKGHWTIHFQKKERKIHREVNLTNSIKIIKECNADIIGICEVLCFQQKELRKELLLLGYKYAYFFQGHKLKNHNFYVTECIVSKYPCKRIDFKEWPVENCLGGGGGFGAIYLPKLKTTLFNAHLGLPGKKYFKKQLEKISKEVKRTKGKILLIGDFNLEYQKIKTYFPNLKLFSEEERTCSLTPIMKLFFWKDTDHIMAKGFTKKSSGAFTGYSDHKLIYADLK
jgi:endonuclease/exonuclease/phosphatase family metal-dependent hydrolase